MSSAESIRVLIADDIQIIRYGLRELLREIEGCNVVAEAENGAQALELALSLNPGLIFLKRDISELDGVRATQRIKRKLPQTRVVLLLSRPEDFWASLEAGADGYMLREMVADIVPSVIQIITRGGAFIGPSLASYLLRGEGLQLLRSATTGHSSNISLDLLSSRERDVLNLLVKGLSNRKIADHLGLSIQTVKVHVRHILKKLQVEDRTQAVLKVIRPESLI